MTAIAKLTTDDLKETSREKTQLTKLNELASAINNLTGQGTAGALAGTTGVFSGSVAVGGSIGPTLSGAPAMSVVSGSVNGLTGGLSIDRASNDANAANLQFYKTRATDAAVQTAVANADVIGNTSYFATDGTTIQQVARVRALVAGAVSAGAVPTDLVFQTTATNSSGLTEALRLKSDQSTVMAGPLDHDGAKIGLFATTPVVQQTVAGTVITATTGTALRSLINALAAYGIIIDTSTDA